MVQKKFKAFFSPNEHKDMPGFESQHAHWSFLFSFHTNNNYWGYDISFFKKFAKNPKMIRK